MILILTGPVQAGKSTFLKNLLPVFRSRKIPVSGYLSISLWAEGRVLGYDLFDIKAGRSVPFLRRDGQAGWEKVGPYFFLPSGLRTAENLILGSPVRSWLLVDEIGPREMSGRGVWPALSSVLSSAKPDCLLVVRRLLLGELTGRFDRRPAEVFDVTSSNILPGLLERMSKSRNGTGKRTTPGKRKSRT